jgi:hypothetical protein
MACIGEIIETFFQFAPALLFCGFCNRFGRAFARLLDAPAREPELVPPDITATKMADTSPFMARISAPLGAAGRPKSSLASFISSCLVHETETLWELSFCGNRYIQRFSHADLRDA